MPAMNSRMLCACNHVIAFIVAFGLDILELFDPLYNLVLGAA